MVTIQPRRKRVKTGCLNCRERHKKCDESKPVCGLCSKRSESCTWPNSTPRVTKNSFRIVKVAKEDEDGDSLHKYSTRLLKTLDPDVSKTSLISSTDNNMAPNPNTTNSHHSTSPRLHNLVDKIDEMPTQDPAFPQSSQNVALDEVTLAMDVPHIDYNAPMNDIPKHSPNSHDGSRKDSSSSGSISPDALIPPFLDYSSLHRTFRDYVFTNIASSSTSAINGDDLLDVDFKNILQSPVPEFFNPKSSTKNLQDLLDDKDLYSMMPPPQQYTTTSQKGSNTTAVSPQESTELTGEEKIKLYKIYLYEVAPWLDMFDKSKQFGSTIPYLASTHPVLLNAIYAVASRQSEQVTSTSPIYKSVRLYQEILKHLIPSVNKTMDTPSIIICVLLCVFEMMSSSPKKWRYHLEGCAALFKKHRIHGFAGPLERGLFWCYARMDVSAAVIGEQCTMIPLERWLPENADIYDSKRLFTTFGDKEDMYANYMVYLCSRVLNLIAKVQENYEKEWTLLWDEIVEWHQNRPSQLMPVMQQKNSTELFPAIMYVNGPAISANQLYHMAIIIMTQNKPRLHKITYSEDIRSPVWHAKQIVAISLYNEHHGCWNNSLQPLWIAGQLLSSEQEHEVILLLLEKIEKTTGWQMNFRAKDLRKHWNEELGRC